MNETVLYTSSAAETERVGAELASKMASDPSLPPFVALYGDLGVGKTAFVRGFASIFCAGVAVRSPTFALVNEYRGKEKTLFHFDMYRIDDEDSLDSIGYWDYLERGGYCFVEWSEKIPFALPETYYRLEIRKHPDDENARTITATKVSI